MHTRSSLGIIIPITSGKVPLGFAIVLCHYECPFYVGYSIHLVLSDNYLINEASDSNLRHSLNAVFC